ncbi:hypothetical protein [Halomarina litorea]|uniref:hypothetical protein n=1 Tax=Halomarina litorea TaxID=2961595 RepID=UPI0020C37B1D|nr:hypothetical protein [Halomarina sp. BCD28]
MWIESIPYAQHLDVFGLIVIGLLVERHYISRPSIFANTIALNVHFYQNPIFEPLLVWYANIGLVFGAIAMLTYLMDERLPSSYYELAMLVYSSIPAALVIFLTL